jgi:hypothetical protein
MSFRLWEAYTLYFPQYTAQPVSHTGRKYHCLYAVSLHYPALFYQSPAVCFVGTLLQSDGKKCEKTEKRVNVGTPGSPQGIGVCFLRSRRG